MFLQADCSTLKKDQIAHAFAWILFMLAEARAPIAD